MAAQQTFRSDDLDVMPVLKMYLESLDAWKKSYENFAGKAGNIQPSYSTPYPAGEMKTAYESALAGWQKSGEEIFKRFVEQQVELCRFMGNRWEQYLKLPEQLAHCRTPADVGQVQAEFISQFANDYMHETTKLSQAAGQSMSEGTAWRPA